MRSVCSIKQLFNKVVDMYVENFHAGNQSANLYKKRTDLQRVGRDNVVYWKTKRKMTSKISFCKDFWTILYILTHIQFWSVGFLLCMFLNDHGPPHLYRDTRDLEIHGRRGSGFKQLYPWTPSCDSFQWEINQYMDHCSFAVVNTPMGEESRD